MRPGEEVAEALRAAIEALGDEEADALLAEARIEAHARVRAILAEVMTQALLERSLAQLIDLARQAPRPDDADPTSDHADVGAPPAPRTPVAPQRPAPAPAPAPDAVAVAVAGGADEPGWYVYCVIGDSEELELPGSLPGVVDGQHVRLVREGELAAVASQVALSAYDEQTLRESLNDAEWLERTARAHERVLDEVRARTTVIPMRLCTIYRSERAVGEMLVRERQGLAGTLARLTGKTEWGVKVFVQPALVERAATQTDGELAKLTAELQGGSAGAAYIRRKQLERLLREATSRLIDESVEDVHARLTALAVEARLSPPQRQEASGHSAPMVLNGAYLLADAATDEFHACVAALRAQYEPRGCELQATGPWPPYNFVAGSGEAA